MQLDSIQYRVVEIDDCRIDAAVSAVNRTHVNGGMIIAQLKPCLMRDFRSAIGNLAGQWPIPIGILSNSVVKSLDAELGISTQFDIAAFARLGGYALEGELTQILLSSGAYHDSEVTVEAARTMSRDLVDLMSSGDVSRLIAYRTYDNWSEWFSDAVWDVTIVTVDYSTGSSWLIFVTDTD